MNLKNKWMVGVFAVMMIAHWLEHAFQAWQVYVMHMPRACALGMLGMKYPWLVKTESLHFGFALFTTVGLLMLWDLFAGTVRVNGLSFTATSTAPWWKAATYISIWHLFEHTLLFIQAMTHPWFGRAVPTSLIQLVVPRIELHLFYNSLVTIPIAVAMWMLYRRARLVKLIAENLTFVEIN